METHICDVNRDGIHRKLYKTLQNHFIDNVERDGFLLKLFKARQDNSVAAMEQCFSTAGPRISYTGQREVLLEFVILVF